MIQTLLAGVLTFVVVIQCMFVDENRKVTAIAASQEPAPPGLKLSAAESIPFSGEVVCESAQTLADGNRIINRTKAMIYRDGHGRLRREMTQKMKDADSAEVKEYKTILVSDPSGGQNFSLDPQKRTALKFPAPVKAIEGIQGIQTAGSFGATAAGNLCGPGQLQPGFPLSPLREIKNEPLGTQLIDGRAADGIRTTYAIPARMVENERSIEITHERWYSRELQLDILIKTIDPRYGETTQQITNINKGEPDHSLFEIPSDYTVREMKRQAWGSAGTQAVGSVGKITNVSFEPQSDFQSPTIISQEEAKYTLEAHQNGIDGIVVLDVMFTADGRITSIRVVRGLADGLTEKAIEAAIKIRFKPALKEGNPVSVRGNIEFTFSLAK